MQRLLNRLKHLLGPGRIERDLDEEIETHRALTESRLRAGGLPAAEAAAASRRVMGNATLAREDARGAWIPSWLDALRQDVAYTFRILRRAPAFAASMIAVMALGLGATTGVFGLVDGIVLRPLPVHAPDRLAYFSRPSFSHPVFAQVREHGAQVFSAVSAWDMDTQYVAWSGQLEPTEVLMASGNFYATLGITAAIGRTFGPDDDRIGGGPQGPVALISHTAWERRFGRDPSVVGRTLRIEDDTFTIIGITPAGFFGVAPGLSPEVTIPLTTTASVEDLNSATSSSVHLLARLRDGVSLAAANTALRTFWPAVLEATTNPGMPPERRAMYLSRTTSLESGRAGFSRVRNQFGEPLWMLLALVALLLTVACASAANLLLARGASRQREISVRLAIGASRRRVIRQMLTESVVWTLLASVAGMILAVWGAGTLVGLMTTSQEQIVVDLAINWRMVGFAASLALLTAVACTVIPALGATRLDPGTSLKETGQIASPVSGPWSPGRFLVAAQVALTVLLLFGASLFVRSLDRVLAQDAGFERENVLVLATDPGAAGYDDARVAAFYDQLLERLRTLPGVQSASLSQYPPISDEDGAWTQSIATDGNAVPNTPGQASVYFNSVSPGYFQTIGTRLLRGRDFAKSDSASAPRVVIINESLARKFFPDREALGRQITIGRNASRRDLQIVGVVNDAKYQRLEEQPRGIAYLPHTQHVSDELFAELRTVDGGAAVAEAVRREVRALDPVVPLRLETVNDRIRESLVTERVIALLAATLGLAALALACAGLYGMVAYAVSRRTREIGLRLALGASRFEVLSMVVGQCLTLAAFGILAGGVAALALGRFAESLLFQVSGRDPMSLAVAIVVMLIVAGLAGLVPARRASRVDPVVALRCE